METPGERIVMFVPESGGMEIGIPFPGPGSVSMKYSMEVMVAPEADVTAPAAYKIPGMMRQYKNHRKIEDRIGIGTVKRDRMVIVSPG